MWKYEVWFESSCLRESDYDYEDEDEAIEEAKDFIENRIEQWKLDGGYQGETMDDFEIITKEV